MYRWEYNNKKDLKEIICVDMDWINLKTGTSGGLL
jgi:hypothetical protein